MSNSTELWGQTLPDNTSVRPPSGAKAGGGASAQPATREPGRFGEDCRARRSASHGRGYRDTALAELLALVVHQADEQALEEFHQNRTVFRYGSRGQLVCADFMGCLRSASARTGPTQMADAAYDLTVAKFSRFPLAAVPPGGQVDPGGPDCRRYFGAYLRYLEQEAGGLAWYATVKGEESAADILQRFVVRHFHLSLREARRSVGGTRYVWQRPEGEVTLIMPRWLAGAERRRWLEGNVEDVDLSQPHERSRIQSLIDERLASDADAVAESWTRHEQAHPPDDASPLLSLTTDGLAKVVAQEKGDAIDRQRPAIQALGAAKLQAMITRVFDDLSDGELRDTDVANEYGLAKATFSRFAGSQWSRTNGNGGRCVPDLWANTAQILASDGVFMEAARAAGVWERVVSVVRANVAREVKEG